MKLNTNTIVTAVIGVICVVIAYFATNFFIGPIESVSYKEVSSGVDANLVDPNPEIFNYKALNPTVEVYVGECTEYNQYGECIDEKAKQENQ